MRFSIGGNFIANVTLIICIFVLRKVDATFSTMREFWDVTLIIMVSFGFNISSLLFLDKTPFVILGYY